MIKINIQPYLLEYVTTNEQKINQTLIHFPKFE